MTSYSHVNMRLIPLSYGVWLSYMNRIQHTVWK